MQRTLTSDLRRARTLAIALAFLLGGTALYVKHAGASPATFPSSPGSPTLAVTAPDPGRENVPAASRRAASTATAWTSRGIAFVARHR